MLKLLKPMDGLSDLLRVLTDYWGNLSGGRNALFGSIRHLKADIAERMPFRQSGGPAVPKRVLSDSDWQRIFPKPVKDCLSYTGRRPLSSKEALQAHSG